MIEQYVIINQRKIDMITDIKNTLSDDLNPYLQKLIEHILVDDAVRFRDEAIQTDIAELIEKHEINVR